MFDMPKGLTSSAVGLVFLGLAAAAVAIGWRWGTARRWFGSA